jgi:hypothetical protein
MGKPVGREALGKIAQRRHILAQKSAPLRKGHEGSLRAGLALFLLLRRQYYAEQGHIRQLLLSAGCGLPGQAVAMIRGEMRS